MAWVRQYSAPNVVGARKLQALIFDTINLLLYDKWSLCIFQPLFGGLGTTYAIHLRFIGKPIVDFLLLNFFSLGASLWLRRYERISTGCRIFEGGGSLWLKI